MYEASDNPMEQLGSEFAWRALWPNAECHASAPSASNSGGMGPYLESRDFGAGALGGEHCFWA